MVGTLLSCLAIWAFLALVPRVGPSVAVALTCGYPAVTALVAGGLGVREWVGLGLVLVGIGIVGHG